MMAMHPALARSSLVKSAGHGRLLTPQQPVRVYRGATHGHAIGLSWTPDRPIAAMFALKSLRHDAQAVLCEMTVEPQRILGVFTMMEGSTEYVINPLGIDPAMVTMARATDPGVVATAASHAQQVLDHLVTEHGGPYASLPREVGARLYLDHLKTKVEVT